MKNYPGERRFSGRVKSLDRRERPYGLPLAPETGPEVEVLTAMRLSLLVILTFIVPAALAAPKYVSQDFHERNLFGEAANGYVLRAAVDLDRDTARFEYCQRVVCSTIHSRQIRYDDLHELSGDFLAKLREYRKAQKINPMGHAVSRFFNQRYDLQGLDKLIRLVETEGLGYMVLVREQGELLPRFMSPKMFRQIVQILAQVLQQPIDTPARPGKNNQVALLPEASR